MSKNKKKNNKLLFDKKADIITSNGEYHIRKNRVYICGSNYYGKVYTISSNRYNRNNVHIIKEIYSLDKNRFRFLMENLKYAKKFRTIEKLPTGEERKIAVIEYKDRSEYICSIGDIKSFTSDLDQVNDNKKTKLHVKKLILKPEKNKKDKDKDKEKRRVA